MKNLIILILIVLLATACGGKKATEPAADATDASGGEQPTAQATEASGREAASIKIVDTPTPKPKPPTPPPRPTNTPAPTPEPTATSAETAAQPEATPTEEPAGPIFKGGPMVEIPAGVFTLGSDDYESNEAPAQTIELPAFLIDQFEVANADFIAFVDDSGYQTYSEAQGDPNWRDEFVEGEENHPVVKVTWNDAAAYCEWAGKRLPTEQEWEKAARGEDARIYPWGNDWDSAKANAKESGFRDTLAVGSFGEGVSPYGVHDMAGNVWEWTSSPFVPYPGGDDSDLKLSPDFRVTRGGAWFEEAAAVRSSNRNAAPPDPTSNDDVGFRCAADM